jgi:phenylacetate-CoA ligase
MLKKNINNILSKIRGINYTNQYLEIQNIQSEDELRDFKNLHLNKLLIHAYTHVPYYHRILKNVGIINDDTVDISKFDKIPILTKNILNNEELISDDYLKRNWYYNFSGGSTGEPTKFIQDISYFKWYNATNKFYYEQMLNIDETNAKKILLWGSPRDLFKGDMGLITKTLIWLTNTKFLNSFKMKEKDIETYLKIINAYKPDLIRGYASSLFELCRFIETKNIAIYSPKMVISSAETLTIDMREKIESVFGTKLYDFYGSRESASIAGECKKGFMHIFSFNNYVEIVNRNGEPVSDGENGRVIVTNLHNYSMPIIRYEIGDMAVLGPKNCSCGNFLPSLKKIHGRIEEQFITKDGNVVIGYFFVHLMGVVLNKGYIKKFQVIQEDYDKIRILAILKQSLPEVEKNDIDNKIRIVMGKDCRIIWEFVDDIPKTKSGKYLYTKTLMSR